jgi:hypothetical protein
MKISHKYFRYNTSNLPKELGSKQMHESIAEVIEWVEENVKHEGSSVEFVQVVVPPVYNTGLTEIPESMRPYFILRTTQIN